MSGRTARRQVTRISLEHGTAQRADALAAEEPLGIRIGGEAVNLTMRTPGDDIDLVAGFLFTEGIVTGRADIEEIRICDGTACGHAGHDGVGNLADVRLGEGGRPAPRRNFLTTSACGVCGRASAAELYGRKSFDLSQHRGVIPASLLAQLPDRMRDAQRVFARTGGLHAAGAFTLDGQLECLREDVGRHNAVDKVIGWALRSGRLPLREHVLLVSGRASFELVSKAVLAGFPVLAAVSAPSSLAADLAEQNGLTLVGFLRGSSMNVYTEVQRVVSDLAGRLEQAAPAPDRLIGLGEDPVDHDADHEDHDHDRDRAGQVLVVLGGAQQDAE
jgi:FdhD protein